jgi:hypothetical protein
MVASTKAKEVTERGKHTWVWAPHFVTFFTSQAGLAVNSPGQSLIERGDVFVFIPAGFQPKWDSSSMEPITTVSAGINLGATMTLTYFAGKTPVSGAPDTRPFAVIYRVLNDTRVRELR